MDLYNVSSISYHYDIQPTVKSKVYKCVILARSQRKGFPIALSFQKLKFYKRIQNKFCTAKTVNLNLPHMPTDLANTLSFN